MTRRHRRRLFTLPLELAAHQLAATPLSAICVVTPNFSRLFFTSFSFAADEACYGIGTLMFSPPRHAFAFLHIAPCYVY